MSNPQPALDWLARTTGMEPGADDALIIQAMFLLLVIGTLFSLIGYWLKLRKSRWQNTWMKGCSLAIIAMILGATVLFAMNRSGQLHFRMHSALIFTLDQARLP